MVMECKNIKNRLFPSALNPQRISNIRLISSLFFISIGCLLFLSCNSKNTVQNKINGKDYCYQISDGDTICLDVRRNVDTLSINELIDSGRRTLLIFTGWAISGKTIIDEENLRKYSVLKKLNDYSIIVLYVDDKRRSNLSDSMTIGEINSLFQKNRFLTVSQPQYIIFSKGIQKCAEHYLPNEKTMIKFLEGCSN